ncbi:MAG: hypothetical protein H0Z38_03730 [Firmicutes bacterium]|nr:hypothetical protein [Bacillota bacterium]
MLRRLYILIFALLVLVTLVAGTVLACVGARPLAMGGAFVAVADDANAVYWNPAGLAQIGDKNESTYMLTLEGNINYRWFFADVERQGDLVFGASGINSLNGLKLNDGAEGIPALFDNTWYQLSFAVPVDDRLSFGTNLKFYEATLTLLTDQTYQSYLAQAAGMDISVHYRATDRLRIGLLTQDIFGSDLNFAVGTIAMATNVRPGVAYDLTDDTTLAFETYDLTGDTRFSFGVEERFGKGALRAGFYHDTWTAGFGLNSGDGDYSFDYCYIYDSHLISLSWAF